MQLRSSRAAPLAFISKNISTLHMCANMRRKPGKMTVPGSDAESVVNDDQPAISSSLVHHCHHAVSRRAYGIAVVGGDIDSRVERAFTTERIERLAKMPRDLSHYRPKRRHNSQAAQFRRRQQTHPAA